MSCGPDKSIVAPPESYIHIIHIFHASPEALFDAWLQPSILCRWMSFNGGPDIEQVLADHRVGGLFWIRERDGTGVLDRYGEYCAIDRPRRLVFSLKIPEHSPDSTCVTVAISPSPNGSVMSFVHTGVRREEMEQKWRKMFDQLAYTLRTSN
jgi:uncharacterized protein YndB with AHSA1/START domain